MDPDIYAAFMASTQISSKYAVLGDLISFLNVVLTVLLLVLAHKGTGAHLLKPGSKRRRRQVDIAGQNEQADVVGLQLKDQQQQIEALQAELSQRQDEAAQNLMAANILSDMMDRGDVEQDADGNVRVSKRKSEAPNIIENQTMGP